MKHDTLQFSTIQYITMQYNTVHTMRPCLLISQN